MDKLEQQVSEYAAIAKENPNVDASMLMMSALQSGQNLVSSKAKRWAYLISIGVPPFGLLFAARYFFADEDDARQVAWTCVALTVIAVLMFWLGAKLLLTSSGTSVDQISKIKIQDIQQLGQ